MKNFNVTFTLTHESYNGYTHRDGKRSFPVEARNRGSAIKKARKQVDACYDVVCTQIEEI